MKYYEVAFRISAPDGCMDDARDLVAALAGEVGFETFEESADGLNGYVQTDLFNWQRLDEALHDFPISGTVIDYTVAVAEDRDWNESWEQEGFEPIVIDGSRCVIHDGRHIPQCTAETDVEIDAKLAFGTGNHETTRMMVEGLMGIDLHGKTVLDAGCGTGILGIVALKRGAVHATGYDIDEWSADNARHNAIINKVEDNYEVLLGDSTVLDTVGNTFDVVVANINRNILLADMPRFVKALNTGGTLLLSGFYTADSDMLKRKAEELGLYFDGERSDNGWACIAFKASSVADGQLH